MIYDFAFLGQFHSKWLLGHLKINWWCWDVTQWRERPFTQPIHSFITSWHRVEPTGSSPFLWYNSRLTVNHSVNLIYSSRSPTTSNANFSLCSDRKGTLTVMTHDACVAVFCIRPPLTPSLHFTWPRVLLFKCHPLALNHPASVLSRSFPYMPYALVKEMYPQVN